MDNWQKLAEKLIVLNSDRKLLSELTSSAALSGQYFDEKTVFQRRSKLIKEYIK